MHGATIRLTVDLNLCSFTLHISILTMRNRTLQSRTEWRLDGPGSNPGGTRFSARPDRPWGPPSLLYNGHRVFPGSKVRPGRAADHSPSSSAAVMEK